MILNEDYFDNVPDIEDDEDTVTVKYEELQSMQELYKSKYSFFIEYQLKVTGNVTDSQIMNIINKAQRNLEHFFENSLYVKEYSNTLRDSGRDSLKQYDFKNDLELSESFVMLNIGFTLIDDIDKQKVLMFLWQLVNSLSFVKTYSFSDEFSSRMYIYKMYRENV